MSPSIGKYSTGTGKIIEEGDFIRVDNKGPLYRVLKIYVQNGEALIDGYGGRSGYLKTRTFAAERCSRTRPKVDPNQANREALHETAAASKSKRKGWR